MKNRLYEFNLLVYPRKIWIGVDCSDEFLKGKFDEVLHFDESCDAFVQNAGTKKPHVFGGILIRFLSFKSMTVSNIAHESTHAALEIFDYIECRIDYKNQEPFSYLTGCIAGFCNQVKIGNVIDGKPLL